MREGDYVVYSAGDFSATQYHVHTAKYTLGVSRGGRDQRTQDSRGPVLRSARVCQAIHNSQAHVEDVSVQSAVWLGSVFGYGLNVQ